MPQNIPKKLDISVASPKDIPLEQVKGVFDKLGSVASDDDTFSLHVKLNFDEGGRLQRADSFRDFSNLTLGQLLSTELRR